MKRRPLLGVLGGYLVATAFIYRFVFHGQVIAARDVFRLLIPHASFLLSSLRSGELPLWIPNERLGQPFVAMIHSQVFYPLQIPLLLAVGPYWLGTGQQIFHTLIASTGAYCACRGFGRSRIASFYAGAAFGLCHMVVSLSSTPFLSASASWSGWILWSAEQLCRKPGFRRAGALAAFLGLSFLGGSPETVLWQALLVMAWVLVAPRRQKVRAALFGGGGLAWSAGLVGVTLLPALQLFGSSNRAHGADEPLVWSTSWAQWLATVWPNADWPRGAYWDGPDQWFVVSVFVGTMTGVLALASLRRRRRIVLLASFALGLALLSLGFHFPPAAELLHWPPFSFFRYPAKYLVGYAFGLAILSGFGLDRLAALARSRRLPRRAVAWTVGAGAALVAIALVATRLHWARPGFGGYAPWAFAIALGLAAAFLRRRPARLVLAAVGLVEIAASHALLEAPPPIDVATVERPSALASVLSDGGGGRVSIDIAQAQLPLDRTRDELEANRWIEEGLSAVEGYGDPTPLRQARYLAAGGRGALDLAGVRYFVRDGDAPFKDLRPAPAPAGLPKVYRSDTALPRAFLTQRSQIVPDSAALRTLRDASADLREVALLASGEVLASSCASPPPRVVGTSANALTIETEACAPSYLVVADAFDPGWKATIDDQGAALERADYALRAVKVPPGRHRVEMRYRPWTVRVGLLLSLVSLAALLLAWLRPG